MKLIGCCGRAKAGELGLTHSYRADNLSLLCFFNIELILNNYTTLNMSTNVNACFLLILKTFRDRFGIK